MARNLIRFSMRFSLRGNFNMFKATHGYSALSECSASTVPSLSDAKLSRSRLNFGSYKDAIHALNSLQSNAMTLELASKRQLNNLEDTWKYLTRTGITPNQLDQLSVIHVSGTKGKGSTCALTESILRSFGLRTGFFSSPHLLSVTERIRIDGTPISEADFTKTFWNVYNSLNSQKDHENDMPAYFKFLTILCIHLFIEKNVNVGIFEVGIGGLQDCTNILRTTKTIGITSLGLEHTTLLGNTLGEIAYQKAGIIKPNSNVFTVSQPDECLNVIKQVAKEKNANLFVVPEFCNYKFPSTPKLQIQSKVQHLNASLAMQLAYDWLRTNHVSRLNGLNSKVNESKLILEGSKKVVDGLEKCVWLGRCQAMHLGNKSVYLDGAHTKESLEVCTDWFLKLTKASKKPKCLIFNATGDRNSEQLMKIVSSQINFDVAFFVPNVAYLSNDEDEISDIVYWAGNQQVERAEQHAKCWSKIQNSAIIKTFPCILDAIMFLDEEFVSTEVDVLITGSLNLIGSCLAALEKYTKI